MRGFCPTTVFIGIGSNLGNDEGDAPTQLQLAVQALAGHTQLRCQRVSPVYRSAPLPINGQVPDQADFYNAVLQAKTRLSPLDLLALLQQQEEKQGRERREHWGARTLDLDLLLYGQQQINVPRLTVPHPGIPLRQFVLQPLHDLKPGLNIPGMGSLTELLRHNPPSELRKTGIDLRLGD